MSEKSSVVTSGVRALLSVVWLDKRTWVKPSSFLTTMSLNRQLLSLCRTLYLSRLSTALPFSSVSFRLTVLCKCIFPFRRGPEVNKTSQMFKSWWLIIPSWKGRTMYSFFEYCFLNSVSLLYRASPFVTSQFCRFLFVHLLLQGTGKCATWFKPSSSSDWTWTCYPVFIICT